MQGQNRRVWALALVAALVLSLAVPSYAAGARGALGSRAQSFGVLDVDNNGNITDVDGDGSVAEQLPSPSPVVGTLDLSSDEDDVYWVDLTAGDKIAVSLTASATGDYGLYLFAPGATDIYTDQPVAGDIDTVVPQVFTYLVPTTGRYYIDVACLGGTGGYTMEYLIDEADEDDDIIGVPLPSSPATGEVDVFGDIDDVYSVVLAEGETFQAWLYGDDELDADLAAFGTSATSVMIDDPLVFSANEGTDEYIKFTAQTAGTYYIDVNAVFGEGDYELYWEKGNDSAISINNPKYCWYGGQATIKGVVSDLTTTAPVTTGEVTLYARKFGTTSWSVAATATPSASGAYSFTVKPRFLTYYITEFSGTDTIISAESVQISVNQKALISTPSAPSKIYKNRYFTTTGTLKPKPNSDSLKIYAYKWEKVSGVWQWKFKKSYTANVTNPSSWKYTSKYSARVRATSSGKWKFVAHVSSTRYHYETYSSGRYRTVK